MLYIDFLCLNFFSKVRELLDTSRKICNKSIFIVTYGFFSKMGCLPHQVSPESLALSIFKLIHVLEVVSLSETIYQLLFYHLHLIL